jgi:hypothetical protein
MPFDEQDASKGATMVKPIAVFLWRNVDHPGHDTCRLFKVAKGWLLTGAAIFVEKNAPCFLAYEVTADAAWRTGRAKISGHVGRKAVDITISSSGGQWRINGVLKKKVTGCIDVDLGFTPATNLLAIRRLSLKIGQGADAPAAYLRFPEMRLEKLPQRYVRTGRTEYQYEAPTVGYSGRLQVLTSGAISRYPRLFELIASARPADASGTSGTRRR